MAWSGRGTGRASSCGRILSPPRSAAEAEPEPPPAAAGAAAAAAAAAAGPVVPAARPPRTTAAAARWKSPWRYPEESEALFPRRRRPPDRERGRGDSRLEPARGVKKVVEPGETEGFIVGREGRKEGEEETEVT